MENLVWKDIGLRKLDGKFGWEIWMKTPIWTMGWKNVDEKFGQSFFDEKHGWTIWMEYFSMWCNVHWPHAILTYDTSNTN
jgi:hypothetical protein